ncbi:unnamed protein product [Symbiodinium sp. KB8]|nr:unnamed protein product [Symbiodinium sp. KB8]
MTLAFTCEAETVLGQELRVVGSTKELGHWNPALAPALKTDALTYPSWYGHVDFDESSAEYKYVVFDTRYGSVTWEHGTNRHFSIDLDGHVHTTGPAELHSSRFGVGDLSAPRIVVASERAVEVATIPAMEPTEIVFEVFCNETEVGDTVVAVGSSEELGNWNPTGGLKLHTSPEAFPRWWGSTQLRKCDVEFKLVIIKESYVEWEPSENRRFHLPPSTDGPLQASCWWSNSRCQLQPLGTSDRTSDRQAKEASFVASGSTADAVGLQEFNSQTNIARPYSMSGNLLGSTNQDDKAALFDSNSFTPFCAEVYEGLFDRELMRRLHGVVLPEAPLPPAGTELLDEPKLCLWAGAHAISKAHGNCEDAHFLAAHSMGVADGVGCLAKYSEYGVNAAAYAAELMELASLALQPQNPASESQSHMGRNVAQRAAAAVAEAESKASAYGGSTIAVLCQQDKHVGVANLGDSGFILLRRSVQGMKIVLRSEEQQHHFNCPYQLTRLPQALIDRIKKRSKKPLNAADKASDCQTYSAEIHYGDLLLMFSDGFSDNVHDYELLDIVNRALPPAQADMLGLSDRCTPPGIIAKSLALAAQERSVDPEAVVPFTATAKRYGAIGAEKGGKEDDITAAAAWVVKDMRTETATEASREESPSQRHTPELALTLFESKRRTRDGASDASKIERRGPRGPLLFPLSPSKAVF